jgi:transposase-like protein
MVFHKRVGRPTSPTFTNEVKSRVMMLVMAGEREKDICEQIGFPRHIITHYLNQLRRKYNTQTTAALVYKIMKDEKQRTGRP